jgi:hypothetical protein
MQRGRAHAYEEDLHFWGRDRGGVWVDPASGSGSAATGCALVFGAAFFGAPFFGATEFFRTEPQLFDERTVQSAGAVFCAAGHA